MVLLDVVYLSMNRNRSYASVTPRLMDDTTLEIELRIRKTSLQMGRSLRYRGGLSFRCHKNQIVIPYVQFYLQRGVLRKPRSGTCVGFVPIHAQVHNI